MVNLPYLLQTRIKELQQAKRVAGADTDRAVVVLQQLLAMYREVGIRDIAAGFFNHHCPICGAVNRTSRRWHINDEGLSVTVCCQKCYRKGLSFSIDYEEIISEIVRTL